MLGAVSRQDGAAKTTLQVVHCMLVYKLKYISGTAVPGEKCFLLLWSSGGNSRFWRTRNGWDQGVLVTPAGG